MGLTPWEEPVPVQGSLASMEMTDRALADGINIVTSREVGMAASLNLKHVELQKTLVRD